MIFWSMKFLPFFACPANPGNSHDIPKSRLTTSVWPCISNGLAVANPETIMSLLRLFAGRFVVLLGAFTAGLAPSLAQAAETFPFDQELRLDVSPMRPAKRMPSLTVAPDGKVSIDLWCKTVMARVELTDDGLKIEPGPLPEALPEMMGNGQCTPERMQADQDLLAVLSQVTGWRSKGGALVLDGPKPLKFRPASN
jgi:heat shock protein HslJ